MQTIVNTRQAHAWNGYEGRHWAEHQDRWDAINSGANDYLFAAAAISEHDRVLDIGCGNGQTSRLAAGLATHGQVLGSDLSLPMLERAPASASAEGLTNIRFEQGDAEVYPLRAARSRLPSVASASCSSPIPSPIPSPHSGTCAVACGPAVALRSLAAALRRWPLHFGPSSNRMPFDCVAAIGS
jgi:SAM-dependent methyltransferase